MNNRFRFRCWDKFQKKMLYDNFVLRAGNSLDKETNKYVKANVGGELLEVLDLDLKEVVAHIMDDLFSDYDLIDWSNFYSLENLVTMQCTGFQDSTGSYIFEGDILEHNGIQDKVEWYYGCYTWNGCPIADYDTGFQGDKIGLDTKETLIIGNIYENELR